MFIFSTTHGHDAVSDKPFALISPDGEMSVGADSYTELVACLFANDQLTPEAYIDMAENDDDQALALREKFLLHHAARLVEELYPTVEQAEEASGGDAAMFDYFTRVRMLVLDEQARDYREYIPAEIVAEGAESVAAYRANDPALVSKFFCPGPEDGSDWDGDFPLVLIRTDYSPFSEFPHPGGNVLMLDPTNDKTLMDSVEAINTRLEEVGKERLVTFTVKTED